LGFELPNKRLQKHDRRWIDYCYNYRICTTNRDTLWERLADVKAMSELSPAYPETLPGIEKKLKLAPSLATHTRIYRYSPLTNISTSFLSKQYYQKKK
jgi:hypothetical protein